MDDASATPRIALLAGATGLVGRALLSLLLASKHYGRVHVLLRRPAPDIKGSPKLNVHLVDFAMLPAALPTADDVFIALGTTIKLAGSEAAFRQVDFAFVVNTARGARAAGATRLAVVSALGADAKSRVFYNRVKGEMEAAIAQLGYETVVVAQPSLLLGDRAALGQPGAQQRNMGGKTAGAARLGHAQECATDPGPRRGVRTAGRNSRRKARRSRPEIGSHASRWLTLAARGAPQVRLGCCDVQIRKCSIILLCSRYYATKISDGVFVKVRTVVRAKLPMNESVDLQQVARKEPADRKVS
jgi:uncharacterized protein YbjT (DUF2867 family)